MAFRDGRSDERARTGAVLVAEGLDHLRVVAEFCIAVSKSGPPGRRR